MTYSFSQLRYRLAAFGTLALFLVGGLGAPTFAQQASDKFSITITPPLFQVSLKPGDTWASSIKVVNTNNTAIAVSAVVKDFVADGDQGATRLLPVLTNDPSGATLGNWLTVPTTPITIPTQKTGDIPFTIVVPPNAAPGGHYAAILIGERAGAPTGGGSQVGTASFVSSLFLVRIAGDVREIGGIREFSTDQTLYETPDARFSIRFENRGNVHIQPQGNVIIYNMWGKERGRIDINTEDANFGNVLPSSTRKFVFSWHGEPNFFEIGKYTAIVTLGYGQTAHQNVSRSVSFWVIPIVPTASVLIGFLLFFGLLIWGIRRYIRRALALEMTKQTGASQPLGREVFPVLRAFDPEVLAGPFEELAELRERTDTQRLLRTYALFFFLFLPMLVIVGLWLLGYFSAVLSNDRPFETQIERNASSSIERQP